MLDRYAEEEARAADPAPTQKGPSLDEAPGRTIAATTVDRCTHDLTAEEVTCALRSNGADELERCLCKAQSDPPADARSAFRCPP